MTAQALAASAAARGKPGLVVGDIALKLIRSSRRKTMQITVERNGELSISAPPAVHLDILRQFVREKRFWIYTKLAEKERLRRAIPRKEFVDGEGFLFLGRSYRLKLVGKQELPLKFMNGRFLLRRDCVPDARAQFVRWYSNRAQRWLDERVNQYAGRMSAEPSGVRVRDLSYRWGSCGKDKSLFFNWKTILLPARIAEYVVVHELAHLHEVHHTPEFWLRLERTMPDFVQRKTWLAEHGIDVEGV
jgi:predicted metal-dependent hydrolase